LNHAHEESSLTLTVHEHSALVKSLQGKIEQLTAEIGLLKAKNRPGAIGMSEGDLDILDENESDQ
jgi:hypothetical protein